jgi:peroxiredoxin Q/BCP
MVKILTICIIPEKAKAEFLSIFVILQSLLKNINMAELAEGMKAPDFSGRDQAGNEISLKDYRGRKVILYFYPKDNTPGCTAEACNLRDNYKGLIKKGFQVIGVSADSEKSHQRFIEKYELPFSLVADSDKEILKAYGAWGLKKLYGKVYEGILRKTFIIDEEGMILKIINKVDTGNHAEQIMEVLEG